MATATSRNIRLGIFTLLGTVFLIAALYFVGNKQNLFGSTFRLSARFYNVNGLMRGNNVRFGGIDVGTVESIEIVNDTTIEVVMNIEKEVQPYIRQNAIASIGSDGLMGNKLVNINGGKGASPCVHEGSVLVTLRPVEMDETIRTLNVTNENIKVITTNLRNITDKINSENSFWNLLTDTIIPINAKRTIVNLKRMSDDVIYVTGDLKNITQNIRAGKGSVGLLLGDTLFAHGMNQTIVSLKKLSDSAAILSGDVSHMLDNLKRGKGTAGMLLNDTILIHNLNKSLESIENGANNFNQNMDALKHTWPFKKYFKKQNKKINK